RGASIKAAEASGNVDVNSGSASDVQQSQRELGELNTATVASNAALQAYGYRAQASYFEGQSNLYSDEATGDIAGGFLSGAGSLLGNAKSLSGIFSSAQSAGPDLNSADIVSAFG